MSLSRQLWANYVPLRGHHETSSASWENNKLDPATASETHTETALSPSSPASNPTSRASEGVSGKSMTGFAEAQPEHPRGSTEGEGQS